MTDRSITRVLVANRGEIALRVFRTCERVGLDAVAICTPTDRGAPHAGVEHVVRVASYLDVDEIVAAARGAGADAVHPGYGFLSENAGFARAVIDAGLTWIGPAPEVIERMGRKDAARELAVAAGVPVVPSYGLADDPDTFAYPVLVKAAAGGGGKGMRVVRSAAELPDALAAARREAAKAFGDDTMLIEKYVESGRHIEVQVMGDAHGTVLHFGERDCSPQRRHQKVLEEAPAPTLDAATRARIHRAAVDLAASVGYTGAGTVEFLLDSVTGEFYFLEMNTRLQVEHPVTEEVYGVDLVAAQIAVAEGGGLPDVPAQPDGHAIPEGHAIEVRLYAEDPAADYQPQTGRLLELEVDADDEFALDGFGIRLDSGFATGDEVGTHYDAMLAKVIAWAPTRAQAARALARTLETARIHGVSTNRDQLVASLRHPAFLDVSGVATSFYDDHPETLQPAAADDLLPFAGAVALAEHRRRGARVQSRIPAGFRNVVAAPQVTRFAPVAAGGEEVAVAWYGGRAGYRPADRDDVSVLQAGPDEVVLDVAGVTRRYAARVVCGAAGADAVLVDGARGGATLVVVPRFTDPADQVAEGSLLAPMPGSVIAVHASAGDEVAEGQPILVMEAMKMQHTIAAPCAGTVTELPASVGQQVEAGTVLAVVEPVEAGAEGAEA